MEEVWRMLVINCTWIIRKLTSCGLFGDLYNKKFLTLTLFGITEGMPQKVGPRALKRMYCKIVVEISCITAVCWKDEREVHYTHMQWGGIFYANHGVL
jgi:hypothetical protein